MSNNMTFHEYYGTLPKTTLRLIKAYNVTPADFDMIVDHFGLDGWSWVDDHIKTNSTTGMYIPRFF